MKQLLIVTALALAGTAQADSLASSASSAGSASSASVSDSIGTSSESSTRGGKVAAGDYRVVALAPMADGRWRVELQGAGDAAFVLRLPAAAGPLVVGETVTVLDRPYGYAFARGPARETFFVALAEGFTREHELKAVTL